MRIAVIGGNLLGSAVVADLALLQEIENRRPGVSYKHHLTLIESSGSLGGTDFNSIDVDGVNVEIGRYRTLPRLTGTYLDDLISLANGEVGTFGFLGRRIKIPGDIRVLRGRKDAAKVIQPWDFGSYRRKIRSFGAWNWEDDTYELIHKGWSVLDLLARFLNNEIWRSVFVGLFLWAVRRTMALTTAWARGQSLVLVVVMFAFVVLSPRGVIDIWQKQYSFWGTTIPLLVKHGLTAGISRGSTIGFVKSITENNMKNRATCAPSCGNLLLRTGFDPYFRASGSDYSRKFKYDAEYVHRYISPLVEIDYLGDKLAQVNSLACHFALLGGDFSDADVAPRLSQLLPANSALCDALVETARATTEVDVLQDTKVADISYDEDSRFYTLTFDNDIKAEFDGIVLCDCLDETEANIQSPLSSTVSELLNYEDNNDLNESEENPYSHLAVILGVASAPFFRFSNERQIPDLVQVQGSPSISRVERLREVSDEAKGIYVIHCSSKFRSSGAFEEMFEEGAQLVHFEKRPDSRYSVRPLAEGQPSGSVFPPLILGNKFIYAAATYRIARHPEMDAMSALNAASLFSMAVNWTISDDAASEDAEGDEDVSEDERREMQEENAEENAGENAGENDEENDDTDFPKDS